MSTTDPERKQAPRTAWINALRGELLRVGKRIPELARVVHVGVWIATYADADGSHSFPGRDTLACLAGCSEETVTRAVKVLMDVGALQRKRRPNASSMYQLVTLLPGPLPWEEHMHHMTDTRQRKAYAKKKAEAVADVVRKASTVAVQDEAAEESDSVRGCVPDSVHGGGSESPPRTRTASMDAPGQRPRTRSGQRPRRGSTKSPLPPVGTHAQTKNWLAFHLRCSSARACEAKTISVGSRTRPGPLRSPARRTRSLLAVAPAVRGTSCGPTVICAEAASRTPGSPRSLCRARSWSHWTAGGRESRRAVVSPVRGRRRTRRPRCWSAAVGVSTGCAAPTAVRPAWSLPLPRSSGSNWKR